MKYIKQFAIIMLISLIGEGLYNLIPLPIPASIYGVVIMFFCLETKIIPLGAVRETGKFLVGAMQIMFIPATVGLIDTWDVFAELDCLHRDNNSFHLCCHADIGQGDTARH